MKKIIWIAFVTLMSFSSGVYATLIGDDVFVKWLYPSEDVIFTSGYVTVGSDAEIVCNNVGPFACSFGGYGNDSVFIDVAAFSVGMTFTGGSTFFLDEAYNGFRFSDLDFSNLVHIVGVTLDTNIVGLDLSDISFGSDFVEINLAGVQTSESYWTISFITEASVPETSSIALLALGLVGLGFARRRKA